MGAAYFDQFKVVDLIAVTNSSMMMLLAVAVALILLKGNRLIPNRWQAIMETIYDHFHGLVKDNSGTSTSPLFLPFLFYSILKCFRVVSLCFYSNSSCSCDTRLVIFNCNWCNFSRALKIQVKLFKHFNAGRGSLGLAPLLVLIETVSYMSRAVSLGVRLAANLSAGHLLFAILAGFGFNMLTTAGILNIFPILIMIFISLLEAAVAVIQAYVFSLLTIIYLADTIVLH